MNWDNEAQRAMERVPFFVRRMAKKKIEERVASQGRDTVTLKDVMASRDQAMGNHSEANANVHMGERQESATVAILEKPSVTDQEEFSMDSGEVTKGGLTESQIRHIEELVEKTTGHESRFLSIKGCGGAVGCPLTLVDVAQVTEKMLEHIQNGRLSETLAGKVRGPALSHHKFKTSVAGCANCCSEPQIKDFAVVAGIKPGRGEAECIECMQCVAACKEDAVHIIDGGPVIDESKCVRCGDCTEACETGSLIAERKGYTILVGGRLGRHPKLAEKLVEMVDEETVYKALDACIELIREEGQGGERLGVVIDRVGIERLRGILKSKMLGN